MIETETETVAAGAAAAAATVTEEGGSGLIRRGRRLLVAGALGALGVVVEACFGKGSPTYDAGSSVDKGSPTEAPSSAPDGGTGNGG
jgi:hypothetical protein